MSDITTTADCDCLLCRHRRWLEAGNQPIPTKNEKLEEAFRRLMGTITGLGSPVSIHENGETTTYSVTKISYSHHGVTISAELDDLVVSAELERQP